MNFQYGLVFRFCVVFFALRSAIPCFPFFFILFSSVSVVPVPERVSVCIFRGSVELCALWPNVMSGSCRSVGWLFLLFFFSSVSSNRN